MPTTKALAQQLGLNIDVRLLPPNGGNIPGALMPGGKFKSLTVHETANYNPGANALMHWNFVKNGGGAKKASFTYCVDSNGAVQILKETEQNNAAGTTEGNRTSLSIETCVNSDGNFTTTLDNLAKLAASILVANDKPLSSMVQHNVWYGKDCPFRIRHAEGGWQNLLNQINHFMGVLQPQPGFDFFPETGHSVGGAIRDHFRANGGVVRYGLPLEGESVRTLEDNNQYTTQMFERALLHWRPGEAVGEARVGWMYLNNFPL